MGHTGQYFIMILTELRNNVGNFVYTFIYIYDGKRKIPYYHSCLLTEHNISEQVVQMSPARLGHPRCRAGWPQRLNRLIGWLDSYGKNASGSEIHRPAMRSERNSLPIWQQAPTGNHGQDVQKCLYACKGKWKDRDIMSSELFPPTNSYSTVTICIK